MLAQKSGLTAADAFVVQYRINAVNPADLTAPQNGGGNGDGWGTHVVLKPEYARLAVYAFAGQLMGFYTGLRKGYDPDAPRHLSRVVILNSAG